MTNLENRLNSFKEFSRQNALRKINTPIDIKKNILTQDSIEMLSNAIKNNNEYIVPMVKVIPTNQNLLNNIFTSDVCLFNAYLIQLAYKIDMEVDFDPTPVGFKTVSDFLLKFLPKGSKVVKPLAYNCNNVFSRTNSWGGFICEFNGASFIALRGTSYNCEIYEDAKILLTTPYWLKTAKVHSGFDNIYSIEPKDGSSIKSLRTQIWDYLASANIKKLFITGHSLGGGISYLLAADITNTLPRLRKLTNFYIIAGPYSGNKSFVDIIMSVNKNKDKNIGIFNMINTKDLVPTIGAIYYDRVPSQFFCFTDPSLSIIGSHRIDNYIMLIGKPENIKIFNDKALKGLSSCGPINCDSKVPTNIKTIKDLEETPGSTLIPKNYIIIGIVILIVILIILFSYIYFKKH